MTYNELKYKTISNLRQAEKLLENTKEEDTSREIDVKVIKAQIYAQIAFSIC